MLQEEDEGQDFSIDDSHDSPEAHAPEPFDVQYVVIPLTTTTHTEVVDTPQREMISSSELPPGGKTSASVPIEDQWVAERFLELIEAYRTSICISSLSTC